MNRKRIVISGMGTVNPLGNSVEETWNKASTGASGIARIASFDPSELPSQIAGEVRGLDHFAAYKPDFQKQAKRLDTFCHYGMAASKEAWEQAGIDIDKDPYGTALVLGSGIGGLNAQQVSCGNLATRGVRGVSPMYIPASIGNIAAGIVSMQLGIKGPNLATQTACATANHAFAVAYLMIQMGYCHSALAGGTEGSIFQVSTAGFARMQALSTNFNAEPERASRPYDKDRDGFVMSEGAGVLVLEELDHAKARGAEIFAELASVGMSGDAYDMVVPKPDGEGALHSMRQALDKAGVNAEDIDYINTHGTSTPLGDRAESVAVQALLKGNEERVRVGSTKGMHGHLLGATAALEAIITVKAIQNSLLPPNINIDQFDSDIALKEETINTEPIEKEISLAVSNSFGFGGHNSSIVLKKFTN